VVASLLYSLVRVLIDVMVTRRSDQADLQAEVLALRRQVQVLERQIKRVRWNPADRMILAALRRQAPASHGLGGTAGQTRDRARLAPSIGVPEVDGLSRSAQAGETADLKLGSPARHPDGP